MISAGDFRNGVTLEIDGNVVQILEFQHVKPGKGAAFVRTKLKNVINGGVVERTFRPTEKFPQARIERVDMQYLYSDGDLFYFMNVENYEQIALNEETIGDALKFVKENEMVKVCSYNGNVLNDMKMGENLPHIATVRSGSFAKNLDESRSGEVADEDVTAEDVRTKVVETVKEIAESVNLEEAQVIVSGGRGMGSKDNFALVEQLAEVLGGVVGATRPAIEEGWVSRAHQVGQSGKIVAPKLYIACGISGATQHVSGMIGSGYIVAINKDEDASIFDVADVGIVGDVTKVLPVMIEEMKKRKAE